MTINQPTAFERFAAASGLITLTAALAGLVVIILGILGRDTMLYTAEAVIGSLLLAMGLREVSASMRIGRHTAELRERMDESEKQNRLLKLTETATKVGHWRLDLTNDAIFWSDGTFAIHGFDPGEIPPLDKAIELFHPEDREIVSYSVESARETGKPYTFQARLMRPDGEIRHTEAVARVEFDLSGKPIALFGVFRDRTEEEIMLEDIRQARDEARALADAKSAFLAKMSHEIRTPMNGVLGFAELLQNSDLNPVQRRHVNLIADSGKSLQSLLNDILDLSKIESGHMTVNPEPTDLGHLINRVAQMTEPMAREKNLHIEHIVDANLPKMVMVDGLRLRQIITNLMHNAVRFTDEGKIRLSASHRGGRLEIQIADTGIGIDQEHHEVIFTAFAQADGGSTTDRGGTGLGLAICRQLAALMDGDLKVQSIPGTGSAFSLSIPLIEASREDIAKSAKIDATALPSPQHSPAPSKQSEALAERRVLLAEDFDINRELMSQMARQIGFTLIMAEDGAEAVGMVTEARENGEPFELVLMDVRMPNMDGLEATRVLRERGFDGAALPIVALTANAFDEDVEACIAAGMQEHLGKPISVETLKEALERWLPADTQRAA